MEQTQLKIRIGDVNYGGHLGHDRLVTLLHQARLDFLHGLGANELDCFGVGLIMRKLAVDYLAEAFLGEVLTIEVQVSHLKPSRFNLNYRVLREDSLVATAQTMMVAFDYQARQVCRLPEAFVDAVASQVLSTKTGREGG